MPVLPNMHLSGEQSWACQWWWLLGVEWKRENRYSWATVRQIWCKRYNASWLSWQNVFLSTINIVECLGNKLASNSVFMAVYLSGLCLSWSWLMQFLVNSPVCFSLMRWWRSRIDVGLFKYTPAHITLDIGVSPCYLPFQTHREAHTHTVSTQNCHKVIKKNCKTSK